jgi:hypothetical protein
MSQVRSRLWVRNGDEVSKIERVYRSPLWQENGLDLDLFLLQTGLACAREPDQRVQRLLELFQVPIST